VQTFDPQKHHGANAARFFNYINLCLGNRFRTMHSSWMKNPICRAGNASLGGHFDEKDSGQVDDEFCHTHSEHLRRRCQRQERQRDARQVLAEFAQFVQREDSSVLAAIDAMAVTATPGGAAQLLGTTKEDFRRLRSRLRLLGRCFQTGERVPKQRRRYTRRVRNPYPTRIR